MNGFRMGRLPNKEIKLAEAGAALILGLPAGPLGWAVVGGVVVGGLIWAYMHDYM